MTGRKSFWDASESCRALATLKSDVVDRMAMTGRAFLGYDICKGLSFQTSIGGKIGRASCRERV